MLGRRNISRRDSKLSSAGRRRGLTITLSVGLGLVVVFSLVFATTFGSRQITSEAISLHAVDEVLRSATIARAQLGLAGHMASVDREVGTVSSDQISVSLAEAAAALIDARDALRLMAESGVELDETAADTASTFLLAADESLRLLEAGDSFAAQVQAPRIDEAFTSFADSLSSVRSEMAESIASSDLRLGRISSIASFLVAFVVPAAVILLYRELVRRQQRQADLEARLAAERNLNQAREEFVANVSHELRTPLTGISGMAMLLAEDSAVQASADALEMTNIVIGEAQDLGRMVEDLLTTARFDAGAVHLDFEDVSMVEEIEDVSAVLAQRSGAIAVDCEPADVRSDRGRLRQVIRNLISNAQKYGGPRIRVTGQIVGKTYLCSVIDDGDGVPESLVPRLFSRFVHEGTGAGTKEGVGLGLSIVQALTEALGGSIQYRRIAGETHFQVRVPLSETQPTAQEKPGPYAGLTALTPRTGP